MLRVRRIPLAAAFAACALALLGAAPRASADDHGNDAAHATAIAGGQTLSGTLILLDQDWFKLDAVQGDSWTFTTTSPWPTDTTLRVYDRNGRTQLAFDDDSGGGRASRLVWKAPSDGTYYVVVMPYDRIGLGRFTISAAVNRATTPPPTGGATLTLDAARVFDPKLDDASASGVAGHAALPIGYRVDPPGSYAVDLDVRDSTGARVSSLLSGAATAGGAARSATWDGSAPLGGNGAPVAVDPGAYKLRLTARAPGSSASSAPLAVLEREVRVVRLAAAKIALAPLGGSGAEITSAYHKSGGVRGRFRPVLASEPEWQLGGVGASDPGDVDRQDGRARPAPQPWTDPAVPPTGSTFSLPGMFTAGTRLQAIVTLGQRPVSAVRPGTVVTTGYPIQGTAIRAVVGGTPAGTTSGGALPSGGVGPGGSYAAPLQAPLPSSLARVEVSLHVTFEYQDGASWRPIAGAQDARIRAYTLLGVPDLAPPGTAAGTPYVPWVAVVDLVTFSIAPGATDAPTLARAVSDHVFGARGLGYDTATGSPAYAMGNLDDLELDLSGFLDAASGRRVNCSDCATAVSTFVNMAGGDEDYAILGWNFGLNYILPLGGSRFTNDPFGTGTAGGFSFHAVGTPDQGATIDDACLSLDGDGQPGSTPCIEARPRRMRWADYDYGLSYDAFSIQLLWRAKLR